MVDVLGTKLDRYDIRERLGKGGMAAVYKGWDTNLDRWVAVKVLHEFLVEEEGFKARFEREAKVVASLNHPNIVQIYDFNIIERGDTPIYYMVMPYIPGKSLKAVMDSKHAQGEHLSQTEIDTVMRGVCSALHYAHAQGMVHRDVTPGNILFNEQGQAVLADFGIARIVSDARLTQSGMTTGTPMYMPPEQGIGKGSDLRSDTYSVGVILYEMLTGQAPYDGDSAIAVIMKHISEPVPMLRDKNESLPPAMEVVIARAMAKDPEDRYQDANDLLADYESAIGGQQVTAFRDKGSTVILPGTAKRGSGALWGAIVGGVTTLIALALILVIISRQPTNTPALSASTNPDAEGTVTLAVAPQTTKNLSKTEVANVPSMTTGPLIFKDDFGADRYSMFWQITTDDPNVYRNIENGVYHIRTTLPATAVTAVFDEEHQYSSHFIYDADFTISEKSQPDTGTGIIFRYQNDEAYYVFAVNGQGQVSIWLRYNNAWTELRKDVMKWTPAQGANSAGKPNHLKLVDLGNRFQGYVNDNLVIDVSSEPALMSGGLGIYVASTSSRKVPNPLADVQVDNFSANYDGVLPSTEAVITEVATP
ncbi:MAG: serine/threonine-protein kinase [Chloroflexota bacterium]